MSGVFGAAAVATLVAAATSRFTDGSSYPRVLSWIVAYFLFRKFYWKYVTRPKNVTDRLTGATVLITGAGSGELGRLFSTKLASFQRVRKFILWDLSQAGLDATKKLILQADSKVIVELQIVNVSQFEAVRKAAEEGNETPDILILNAGIVLGKGYTEDKSESDVHKVFGVNVYQLFHLTKVFLADMYKKTRFTKVITLASCAGLCGNVKMADYCASKAAALLFTESLNCEMIARGVRTRACSVCPYLIDTGMFDGCSGFIPWLLPLLDPQYVINSVVENAILGDSDFLPLPNLGYAFPLLRMLPVSCRKFLGETIGLFTMMDGVRGRELVKAVM